MGKISGGATLSIKLKLSEDKFNSEAVEPGFWAGWEEEMPDDWTDAQKIERIKEINRVVREALEEKIDEDIEAVRGQKVYAAITTKMRG
jgi:hypothetical protein